MHGRIAACVLLLVNVGFLEAATIKCNSPMEIAVVVDVSDNLSPRDFPEIKKFLRRLGSVFHVSGHASHMSVILAGAEVRVLIGLSDLGANRNKLPQAIENLKPLGGTWNLTKALRMIKERVFSIENGVRNFLPRIVVVITNGKQLNRNPDLAKDLQNTAKELHDMGDHVYAVGTSRDEMALMVKNKSEYLYQIDAFKDMNDLAVNVSLDICKRHDVGFEAICKRRMDVGFIVDSSGSIGDSEYINIKNFMKGVAIYMGFKPGSTHIGVVLYSKEAEVWTEFGKHANLRKLFRVLWKMPHHQDVTRIDLGLHVANTKLFTKEAGMREGVEKIAILFTDGEQTTKDVDNLMPLREAADALRKRGITVFAVGIGSFVKSDQLLKIAGKPENVILLRSFSELEDSTIKIAASICQVVAPPVINFTQPVYVVKEEQRKAVVGITVTKSNRIVPLTVSIVPNTDTASDHDFERTVKNVTFQPGETGPKFVEIGVMDDFDVEPTEEFTVSLSSNSPAVLGEPATVYISNDDVPPPVINFTQSVYNTKESKNPVVGISVTDGEVSKPTTVSIVPSTNTAGSDDFDGTVKSVTFQPGETGPKFVAIDVMDDFDVEPTEKFTVSLSSDSRAVLGEPAAVYILNDDVPPPNPVINFTQPVYNTKESKNLAVGISVTDGEVSKPVTVSIIPNTDTAGDDDFDGTVKKVTFQPGEIGPKFVEIEVVDDLYVEPTEKFTVSLSSDSRAVLGKPAAVYIANEDVPPPVINFTQPIYNAKESENPIVGISVTNGVVTKPVTLSITPNTYTAGDDDFDGTVKSVTFQPGEIGPKFVEIEVVDDFDVEPTEKFAVSLSSDSPAVLGEPAAVYIINDDVPPPNPVINFTRPVYNTTESKNLVVGISVTNGEVTKPVTVSVIPNTDTAGDDDFDGTVKNVTFQPGETGPKFVEIDVMDDFDVEPTEKFTVSLSSNSRAVLGKPAAVHIINDDEIQFSFKNAAYDVKENEKPVLEIQLTSGKIREAVTIKVTTVNGTADDTDFVPVTKFVTFEPGETKSKFVEIDLIDDDVTEPTEEFTVSLSSSSQVRLGSPTIVRIEDNDAQGCNLDIGFLIDSTASMRNCNFQKEKGFVKEIAGYFHIAPGATRTSAIIYGPESVLAKRFNETKTFKQFQTDIDKLEFLGGRANLDKAMHLAASVMFNVKSGMRTNVPKVLVVLNDGAQAVITQSAKDISSMLRMSEVRVVVVGVGEADPKLLAQIVASPEDLIIVERFEDAKGKLVALLKRFCLTRDYTGCKLLKKFVDLNIGGCVSEKLVEIGVCGGHCSSFSNFVKRNGFYELGCDCCRAKTKVTKTVELKCSMSTYQAFNIREAETCSCEACEMDIINVQ